MHGFDSLKHRLLQRCFFQARQYLFFLFIFGLLQANAAEASVEKNSINIGSSLPLSGVAKASGLGVQRGIETYIAKMNAAGGIQGRKLEMVFLDDGYEPESAALNVRRLIQKDQVLGLLGNSGTPTILAALSIVDKYKTLLFAPRAWTDVLYELPPDRYVFNFRASYKEEVEALISGVLSIGIKPEELAFCIQTDAYGEAIYRSGIKALKDKGFANAKSLPSGSYNRDALNVEVALAAIVEKAKKPPKAIILGGFSRSNAKFINLAHKKFPKALFLTPSAGIVITTDLEAKDASIIVTQAVPPPTQLDLPAVQEYQNDVRQYATVHELNFVSFESYLATKLLCMALQKASLKNKLTREGIIDVLETMSNVDLGIGVLISLSKDNHQALHTVWPTILKDGRYSSLDWSQLK